MNLPESAGFKKIVCFYNNSDWVLKAAAEPSYPVLELGLFKLESKKSWNPKSPLPELGAQLIRVMG